MEKDGQKAMLDLKLSQATTLMSIMLPITFSASSLTPSTWVTDIRAMFAICKFCARNTSSRYLGIWIQSAPASDFVSYFHSAFGNRIPLR